MARSGMGSAKFSRSSRYSRDSRARIERGKRVPIASIRSDLQPAQAVSERRDHRVRVENSESMEERDIATDFQARYFYVASRNKEYRRNLSLKSFGSCRTSF